MASIGRARCRGAFAAKLFVEELRNGLTVYPYTAETAMLAGWIDEEQTAVATALLEQPPVVAIGSSFSDDLHVKFTLGPASMRPNVGGVITACAAATIEPRLNAQQAAIFKIRIVQPPQTDFRENTTNLP